MSHKITITVTVDYDGDDSVADVATELAGFLVDNCTDEYFPSLSNAAVESVAVN